MNVSKGESTHAIIIDKALDLASSMGLEGLSIGQLARHVGMSKSGLYAHFDAKEQLQQEVLHEAADRFVASVIRPALRAPRGIPRLEALFEAWMAWQDQAQHGGCIFASAAMELDDRDGPLREVLVDQLNEMLATVAKAAALGKAEGQLRDDLDPQQFAFAFWAIMMARQTYLRLLRSPQATPNARQAYQHLIDSARA